MVIKILQWEESDMKIVVKHRYMNGEEYKHQLTGTNREEEYGKRHILNIKYHLQYSKETALHSHRNSQMNFGKW